MENGNLKFAAARTDAELARLREERARVKSQEAAAAAGKLTAQHRTAVLAAQVARSRSARKGRARDSERETE